MTDVLFPNDPEVKAHDLAIMDALARLIPRERVPGFIEALKDLERAEKEAVERAAAEHMGR